LTIEDGTKAKKVETKPAKTETVEPASDMILDLPGTILELRDLLLKNPGVKIINSPDRFTVLRQGKYVGGRINELVFRVREVTDYIMSNPAEEIDGSNLILK